MYVVSEGLSRALKVISEAIVAESFADSSSVGPGSLVSTLFLRCYRADLVYRGNCEFKFN